MPFDPTPQRDDPDGDLLRGMLDLLSTGGWVQGAGKTGAGRCLGNAMQKVLCLAIAKQDIDQPFMHLMLNEAQRDAVLTTEARLCSRLGMPHGLVDWNDATGRTFDQVRWLLEMGIAKCVTTN